jgi:hypothetical protein
MHPVVKPVPVKFLTSYEVTVLSKLRHLFTRIYSRVDVSLKTCTFQLLFDTGVPGSKHSFSTPAPLIPVTQQNSFYSSGITTQDNDRIEFPNALHLTSLKQNLYYKPVFFLNQGYFPGRWFLTQSLTGHSAKVVFKQLK